MSQWIEKDEATAARRRVPCRIFTSDGTSPDTGAQGDAIVMAVHSLTTISVSSALTAIHASQGMYMIHLTQSEVSLLGTHALYHIAGDFPQHIATIQIVNSNPFSTLSAISNVTLAAGTHSGATVQGVSNYANISNVTLHAGTHSNVTIQGVTRVNSGVTLNADTHSGATIQGVSNYANISNVTLHAGTHSNVTIQGVSNYANLPLTSIATSIWSAVRSDFTTPGSFGEYTYSQVTGTSTGTVRGVENYANISNVTLHAGTHSDVTIQGVTRVLNLSANGDKTGYALTTAAERSIASSLLSTNLGNDRYVQDAIFVLRNRVFISGSTMTVYHPDDSTSAWTASVTTGTNTVTQIDPGGA